MDPRDTDHKELKFGPEGDRSHRTTIAVGLRLHRQLIVSTEDGTTCGTWTAPWRHHVMMINNQSG